MNSRQTYDADFTVVPESKRSSSDNLPATLESVQLIRHNLLRGQNSSDIEKIAEELDLDKKLGLNCQAEITSESSLKRDIDELTSSKDYFQVSKGLLEKLFSISMLQRKCYFHNLKKYWSSFIKTGFSDGMLIAALIFAIAVTPSIKYIIWTSVNIKWDSGHGILCSVLGMIMAILFIVTIISWAQLKFSYETMRVKLNTKPLREVKKKIPYGAKLKVLEAQTTGIFEDFIFAQPEFFVENKTVEPRIKIDPAILGMTKDQRLFMIVYWDVEHDVEHVLKQIDAFKKFKLK
jgi:hypothetical protein